MWDKDWGLERFENLIKLFRLRININHWFEGPKYHN